MLLVGGGAGLLGMEWWGSGGRGSVAAMTTDGGGSKQMSTSWQTGRRSGPSGRGTGGRPGPSVGGWRWGGGGVESP